MLLSFKFYSKLNPPPPLQVDSLVYFSFHKFCVMVYHSKFSLLEFFLHIVKEEMENLIRLDWEILEMAQLRYK